MEHKGAVLVNIDDIANRHNVSKKAVDKWISRLRLDTRPFPNPVTVVDRRRYWDSVTVDRWVKAYRSDVTAKRIGKKTSTKSVKSTVSNRGDLVRVGIDGTSLICKAEICTRWGVSFATIERYTECSRDGMALFPAPEYMVSGFEWYLLSEIEEWMTDYSAYISLRRLATRVEAARVAQGTELMTDLPKTIPTHYVLGAAEAWLTANGNGYKP